MTTIIIIFIIGQILSLIKSIPFLPKYGKVDYGWEWFRFYGEFDDFSILFIGERISIHFTSISDLFCIGQIEYDSSGVSICILNIAVRYEYRR